MNSFVRKNNIGQSGFSLVEILVSLGLFTMVVTISVGALLALIDANSKAQTLKTSMDNLSFAVDAISRKIRTGDQYFCDSALSDSGSLPSGVQDCATGDGLVYTDGQTGDRVAYRLNNSTDQIERRIESGSWVPLTADEITINTLTFVVDGTTVGDENQPTVGIWIEGETGSFDDTRSEFELQTTVTQRILDL